MANKVSLSLVLGGAVAASVGNAFRTVEGGIDKLAKKGDKAKVLKSTIGETMKLQTEWKRAHDTGAASADKLLRKLNTNLDALRKQGVEVGRLGREYQRLGREAKAADLHVKGHQQIAAGRSSLKTAVGATAVGVGLAAVPTKISADYQAIIRDIAIKSDAANTPKEVELSRAVIQTSSDTGMSRNDVADLINQLVGAGMELDQAMSYAKVASKFAVGQGASGVDTASMIMALQQNAKITDPKMMQQALEAIAFQGQAGSFEANDMAKWFPQLLAGMEKNGITGMEAVTSLGSMLQVQMKTAGSSDEAANNFKNWMEKIGAGDVVKAYKDAGIDYQASLNTGLQKGMNVIEASMALAMQYVQATDPAKAKKLKDAQAKIDKEVDPEKAKAALEALEKTLRTGDLFADMQVKAALTAYGQNRGLYNELKADSQKAAGILDKNLAERRETSSQIWSETLQAVDDGMRSVGDAIRPATDAFAKGAKAVAHGLTWLSDGFPMVVQGIAAVVASIAALATARSALKIGRGVLNLARGRVMERTAGRASAGANVIPKTGNPVVDAGLGALGKVLGAPASNDPASPLGGEPLKVFVVNAGALGAIGGGAGGDGPGRSRRSGRAARRGRDGRLTRSGRRGVGRAVARSPVPAVPAVTTAAPLAGAAQLGRFGKALSVAGKASKLVPGGAVLDSGMKVLDTALTAETKDEKAEGYGSAAGGLAGALAGGAAGAALGSVVPIIGTAIGGAIGAALGSMGGDSLGGWLGLKLFGDDKPQAVAKAPTGADDTLKVTAKTTPSVIADDKPRPLARAPGDVARDLASAAPPAPTTAQLASAAAPPKPAAPKVDQSFSFAPSVSLVVQGDVKDPAMVVRSAESTLRSMWDGWQREAGARMASGRLYDSPDVA